MAAIPELRAGINLIVSRKVQAWAIPMAFLIVGLVGRFVALALSGFEANIDTFVDAYCRWDCNWYMDIARNGYQIAFNGSANWAFFPLLPTLIAILKLLTGWSVTHTGTVLAVLIALCAARFGRSLCATQWEYVVFCAFLLCGPASFYFAIPYTEGLFIMLTVVLQVFLLRRKYIAAGIAGAFLSANRAVGVFAAAPILILAVHDHFKSGGRLSELPAALWRQPDALLGAAIVPLGLDLFSIYLRYHMGDGLAVFMHIQREWGRELTNPFISFWASVSSGSVSPLHLPSEGQIMAVACIIGLVLSARLAQKKDYAMAIFCAACAVAPMLTGTQSMFRFVMSLPPLWLILAHVICGWRYGPYFFMPLIVGSGLWMDILWLTGHHVLV